LAPCTILNISLLTCEAVSTRLGIKIYKLMSR
jgi:hypothetical protein